MRRCALQFKKQADKYPAVYCQGLAVVDSANLHRFPVEPQPEQSYTTLTVSANNDKVTINFRGWSPHLLLEPGPYKVTTLLKRTSESATPVIRHTLSRVIRPLWELWAMGYTAERIVVYEQKLVATLCRAEESQEAIEYLAFFLREEHWTVY
jgi:hypothetical protein